MTVTYDQQHRQYTRTQGGTATTDTHDAVGNVAAETGSSTETYTYDADNELTQASFSPTLYIQYTYDRNGNQKTETDNPNRGTMTYGYDYENRLISTYDGFNTCRYTYAPTGERVTAACTGGATAAFGYDYGSGGTPNLNAQYTTSGSVQDRYVQSDGVDTPLELTQGSATYAYEVDGLGSVNRLTSPGGATAETYTYDPWGGTTATGTVSNSLQYGAREYDSMSGLYYDRARFYDPSADAGHRFLSADPAGGGYAYVGDSPMNFVDPTGMAAKRGGGGAAGYTSAYCDGWAVAAGLCIPSNSAPDATLLANSYTSPNLPHPVKDCTLERTMFIIGLVLSIVGLSFGSDTIREWAGPIARGVEEASNGLGMSVAIGNIIRNGFSLNSLFDILDFMSSFFFDLIIPSMGFWQGLAFTAQIIAMLNPVGIITKLAAVVFDVASFIDLQAEGCGF